MGIVVNDVTVNFASLSVCVFRITGIDGGSGESEVTVNC